MGDTSDVWAPTMFIVMHRCTLYIPPIRQASSNFKDQHDCVHTLVWPLPHRPVQLGWTCQECETPTDVALGVIEARQPSHHFKVHAPVDGLDTMNKFCFQPCNLRSLTLVSPVLSISSLAFLPSAVLSPLLFSALPVHSPAYFPLFS